MFKRHLHEKKTIEIHDCQWMAVFILQLCPIGHAHYIGTAYILAKVVKKLQEVGYSDIAKLLIDQKVSNVHAPQLVWSKFLFIIIAEFPVAAVFTLTL